MLLANEEVLDRTLEKYSAIVRARSKENTNPSIIKIINLSQENINFFCNILFDYIIDEKYIFEEEYDKILKIPLLQIIKKTGMSIEECNANMFAMSLMSLRLKARDCIEVRSSFFKDVELFPKWQYWCKEEKMVEEFKGPMYLIYVNRYFFKACQEVKIEMENE